MKTVWIEDEDALNIGRVIVTKTGTKDCVVCYSCDEIDDYETRLKADMVAMLVEIQLEIEESENCGKAFHLGLQMASNIIQQKIDKLKGGENGNPNM